MYYSKRNMKVNGKVYYTSSPVSEEEYNSFPKIIKGDFVFKEEPKPKRKPSKRKK